MLVIVENETKTISVKAGLPHVFGIAGTWDSMTATLKWSDGTTDISIQAFTADAAIKVIPPTNILKLVTGADATNTGSLIYSCVPIVEQAK